MLRFFSHYVSARKLRVFLSETVTITLACLAGSVALSAALAQQHGVESRDIAWVLAGVCLGFVLCLQFALYLQDLYDFRIAGEDRTSAKRLLRAAGTTAVLIGLGASVLPWALPSGALLGGAVGAITGLFLERAMWRTLPGTPTRVLLIGDGVKTTALFHRVVEQSDGTVELASKMDPSRDPDAVASAERIIQTAERVNAEWIVVASDEATDAPWINEVLKCRLAGIRVFQASGMCERLLRCLPVLELRPWELVFADEFHQRRFRRGVQRAFDIVMAGTLLLVAAPLMLLVALAVRLDSPGPIFYSQERVGRFGRLYRLWKFRSMRSDAEKNGAVWARTNDDRVTRVGRFIRKTRIDEVPQVFNVLRGEMSFVGPRPERPMFVEQLKREIPFYGMRELVKPGLTGWAQIRYPYGASVEDARKKLEFDLYYIKNGSLFLDISIVFHTVRHVLQARGAR